MDLDLNEIYMDASMLSEDYLRVTHPDFNPIQKIEMTHKVFLELVNSKAESFLQN